MSFEEKKWEIFTKISEIFGNFCNLWYPTPGSRKNNPFGPNLTSGYPPRVGFLVPLGHNPTTGYPPRILGYYFFTPPTLYRAACAPLGSTKKISGLLRSNSNVDKKIRIRKGSFGSRAFC